MGGETLREGDRVSCPAWLFDEPGAAKEERWSFQTYGKAWRHARVRGVVVGGGGDKWKIRWDEGGGEDLVLRKNIVLEGRAKAAPAKKSAVPKKKAAPKKQAPKRKRYPNRNEDAWKMEEHDSLVEFLEGDVEGALDWFQRDDMSFQKLGDEYFEPLCNLLSDGSIHVVRNLSFHQCCVEDIGAAVSLVWANPKTLESLSITRSYDGELKAHSWFEALAHNTSLKSLLLAIQGVTFSGEDVVDALDTYLPRLSLEKLYVEMTGDLSLILDLGAILLRGRHSLREFIIEPLFVKSKEEVPRFDDSIALKKLVKDLKAKKITFEIDNVYTGW